MVEVKKQIYFRYLGLLFNFIAIIFSTKIQVKLLTIEISQKNFKATINRF